MNKMTEIWEIWIYHKEMAVETILVIETFERYINYILRKKTSSSGLYKVDKLHGYWLEESFTHCCEYQKSTGKKINGICWYLFK